MLHNRADLNFSPSLATKRMLEQNGFRHVQVWPRGVDTVRFHPDKRSDSWRRRLCGGEPEKILLLYVGRVSYEKRIDWVRPVLDALPGVRFAVVGDGPARKSLERKYGDSETVFTGYLHGEDLAHAYASADMFVFASQYETVGNVILEAMASGLPVVAPRSGGPLDHVSHGSNGLLFDPDDQNDFISAVGRIVSHPARMHSMGREGRGYAEQQDWTGTLDALLDRYLLMCTHHRSTSEKRRRLPLFLDRVEDVSGRGKP
jgi:glycosyltransferase involved in cell wall biosynthesis